MSRHTASGGSGSIFYTFDERGNTVQRLDSNGNVLSSHLSDAFGVTNTTAGTVTTSVGASDPFQFGGQSGYYTDIETGLVLCGHRYYDPGTGRWLNRDPIGYTGGINLYAYCKSNPVNFTDPLGFYGSGGGDIITNAKAMVSTGIRNQKTGFFNEDSKMDMIEWLQDWYSNQCDGNWEHQEGIKIQTLDNPGWHVSVSHKRTPSPVQINLLEEGLQQESDRWIKCYVEGDKFIGFAGPKQFTEILGLLPALY